VIDKLAKKGLTSGLRLIAFQLFIVLMIALISTVLSTTNAGYSALAGGFTFLLPNSVFVFMSFAHAGARQSKIVLKGFYVGEALKIFLILILLVLFLSDETLSLIAFYISFSLLIASQSLAFFFFKQHNGMTNGINSN
jgi:ATP synthase protein I